MSLSTLTRRLREFGLNHYDQYQNSLRAMKVMTTEFNGAGCMWEYQSM